MYGRDRKLRRVGVDATRATLPVAVLLLSLFAAVATASPRSARTPIRPDAAAASPGVTVRLAGGAGPDELRISLSADGRTYLIASSTPLKVGGTVCTNPPAGPDQVECEAAAVGGFEFDGGAGEDTVIVAASVPVPVTLRGGSGNDLLVGGAGNDLLVAGPGEDVLVGGGGNNRLVGGSGDDLLIGGPGQDTCYGGGGEDAAIGCETERGIAVNCESVHELRAADPATPCGRWARRHPVAIARLAALRRLVPNLQRRSVPLRPRR